MRGSTMRIHTRSGTSIASRAVVQIQHEDALPFIQALRDIFIENPVTDIRAAQSSKRLLNNAPAKNSEFTQHTQEIDAVELR